MPVRSLDARRTRVIVGEDVPMAGPDGRRVKDVVGSLEISGRDDVLGAPCSGDRSGGPAHRHTGEQDCVAGELQRRPGEAQ
ncbi:hypothetical protein [Curtobacterium sp. MCBD17_023]|uniref:hypothetical protein n=1 Tax=Curtobacterium sp. MCBD17_023 TaxID=2175657 RepID=UPI000D844379|nr:hypothetical protein [Curtobacterium sp. MCBD17_023]PYY46955.1 hypothetical protein DEI84_11900 [Curtobacterium sp. MCBD17_023]